MLERDCGARMQQCCSVRRRLCAQLRHQGVAVTALAIAEFSTTGALAARVIRLLSYGLLSCGPTVHVRDRDAWVQQRCSAGRVLCAQLPADSQV